MFSVGVRSVRGSRHMHFLETVFCYGSPELIVSRIPTDESASRVRRGDCLDARGDEQQKAILSGFCMPSLRAGNR